MQFGWEINLLVIGKSVIKRKGKNMTKICFVYQVFLVSQKNLDLNCYMDSIT